MIRTIIQQRNSYTITLPKKWADKFGLKNKDQVKVEEDPFSKELKISPLKTEQQRPEITFDIKGLDERNILNIIQQTYRSGYDKITLTKTTPEQEKIIEKIVREKIIGFTTIKKKEKIIIEALTTDEINEEKINNLLRKLFFIIKETYEAKTKQEAEELKTIMDQTTNYLRRIIIKFDYEGKKAYHYVMLIHKLSLVQHAVYRAKQKPIKKLDEILKKYFEELEKSYWEKDFKLLSTLDAKRREIEEKIDQEKETTTKKYYYEQARNTQLAIPNITYLIISEE